FILNLPLTSHHSITSSARASRVGHTTSGRSPHRPSARTCSAGITDSTLDHLAEDRLHVCRRKRSQRLRANISKSATAQSKRSHGNVIWCLDNRDDVILS